MIKAKYDLFLFFDLECVTWTCL